MNVLMLSIDEQIFEEGSEARERIRALGSVFDTFYIIAFTRRKRSPERIAGNVFVCPVFASPFGLLRAVHLGSRILRQQGRDAIITSQDAFTNIVGFILRRRFQVPLQVQIHTDFLSPYFRSESFKNYLRYCIYCWSVKRAECVRVVSQRIADSLNAKFKLPTGGQNSKVAVLPVFVDVKRISESLPSLDVRRKYPGFHPIVLVLGRLTREKNLTRAIEAFSDFAKEFPKALLIVVGEGPEAESLKLKVKSLKLDERVRFEGWQRDPVSYYKGADVLMVTSRYEGYGRMLVEAAAAGLPIVSTEVGVVGELLKPGDSVLTFQSAREVAECLRRITKDHELRFRLRENALKSVLGMPDFPGYLQSYRASLLHCFNPRQ